MQVWLDYNKDRGNDPELKEKRLSLNKDDAYPVLWNAFKRVVLQEGGLHVVTAPSKRGFFAAPHSQPAPHPPAKEGKWRELVTAPCP